MRTQMTVTLDFITLRSQYVTLLARAAMLRIERARSDAYWASDSGRARSAAMYCGEQDALATRLANITEEAEDMERAAAAIAEAIHADSPCYPMPRVFQHELTLSEVLRDAIGSPEYIETVLVELREIAMTGKLKQLGW
jgi:hypothetical protein